ncbi:MAG: sugar ABC transporter substrate-binding protein [Candidatus Omnitrophica bacterium]|nr:sugar ABC transporter substrate-binding protein [Candidatus Omnitrophota bacterium]
MSYRDIIAKFSKKILPTFFFGGIILLIFSLCSFHAGCGKAPDSGAKPSAKPTEVSVAFWGSPEEIYIITNAIKKWEMEHPEIKIRFEHTPYTGYVSKILTRIAGGAAPDIIATEVDYFVTFAEKGVLEDLNPFLAKDTYFNIKDFFPEVVDRFTVNGNLYAIPRDTAPFACVFYNKDLFDAAGIPYPNDSWTWSDMLEKAKALTKRDESGRVIQYGFYGWAWQNFVYGMGGSLVDDVRKPTRTTLDDPSSIAGLQFYTDLITRHKVMPSPSARVNMGMGVDIMFVQGHLAMFLSGVWESPNFRSYDFNWDVAMFPVSPVGLRRFGTGGTGYCILKSSKHKKEAWEVIKALSSPVTQAGVARDGLAQPARIAVSKGPDWATDQSPPLNKGMLNEAVKDVVYDPFSIKWSEAKAKIIEPEFDLLFNGKETVEEAVTKIVPKVNELLQEKNK